MTLLRKLKSLHACSSSRDETQVFPPCALAKKLWFERHYSLSATRRINDQCLHISIYSQQRRSSVGSVIVEFFFVWMFVWQYMHESGRTCIQFFNYFCYTNSHPLLTFKFNFTSEKNHFRQNTPQNIRKLQKLYFFIKRQSWFINWRHHIAVFLHQ